ncbi:MAG: phosphoribulokinase [Gammaproteobacteria bacterium]|nr:phosphoribulokinase [Gammaproteobacteria bacterium]MDH5802410.1 phosphoribulokinase [Gammaproteobacteria bacterium]
MSARHPIIAITGSSGLGTTVTQNAFTDIFRRLGINASYVLGNGFRRYEADQVVEEFKAAAAAGRPISHFGPETNLFDRLESLFREYARKGTGLSREYIANEEQSVRFGRPIGTYSNWEDIPTGDLLFYEGQHGACIEATWSMRSMSASHNPVVINERHKLDVRQDAGVDIARWVDLLIGIVPCVNMEWIEKIHRDGKTRQRSADEVTTSILRRLPDYVRYITPQFSLTDINFQRVPLVDTSNPFISLDVPGHDESLVVIRFREPYRYDFPRLLNLIDKAYMSRPNTMVIPGGEMENAIDVICTPLVQELMEKKRQQEMV